jgi:hypothetical protein
MPSTARFDERVGKIYLPEAEAIDTSDDLNEAEAAGDFSVPPESSSRDPTPDHKLIDPRASLLPVPKKFWPRICFTRLREGCYTLGFTPKNTPIFGTRFRGTLRVERLAGNNIRFSGDLYTRRLFDDIVLKEGILERTIAGRLRGADAAMDADEAADTGGTIPIFARRKYHSYLKGTSAQLFKFVTSSCKCSFTLNFDQFNYNHPATGFSGSFNVAPTRSIRFVLRHTNETDFFTGDAFEGTTHLGSVSIRWVSPFFRRASLQLNTLQGFEAPPASVGTSTFATIFADAGWDLSFSNGGTVPLPAPIAGINPQQCWSDANLHALMTSVPGYNAAQLDSVWRVHLVAVPARIGCGRGIMFDSLATDPNDIAREGSATFSRDGYPSSETPHYDGAADQEQRNVPRAFLRSATHEVGHAFNQIHQGFEGGNDNSIMTPTPGVATVLGVPGTFPDDINLAFNETVKKHLRHLPDPAVRPGAMDFFGSAVSAPEAADVAWPETLELTLQVPEQVALGEPVEVAIQLKNVGEVPIPVPTVLSLSSLVLRINSTDPTGKITFMRPANITSCPHIELTTLQPGRSISGETVVYWGRDGFMFESPGRHLLEVIVLWDIAGTPIGAAATRDIFVNHPVSQADNDVAALLLNPEVGKAVASRRAWAFKTGVERIQRAATIAKSHPAAKAVMKWAVLEAPRESVTRASPASAKSATRRKAKKGRS